MWGGIAIRSKLHRLPASGAPPARHVNSGYFHGIIRCDARLAVGARLSARCPPSRRFFEHRTRRRSCAPTLYRSPSATQCPACPFRAECRDWPGQAKTPEACRPRGRQIVGRSVNWQVPITSILCYAVCFRRRQTHVARLMKPAARRRSVDGSGTTLTGSVPPQPT